MFSLLGPGSAALLEQLGLDIGQLEQPSEQLRRHVLLNFGGKPVIVAAGSGLASPGFTLVSDESVAGELWAALSSNVRPSLQASRLAILPISALQAMSAGLASLCSATRL